MQFKIFVFLGVPGENSNADLGRLLEGLNTRFSSFIQFERKDNLLFAMTDEVSFYVSILNFEDEMADWMEMGKDFELSVDVNDLNKEKLEERYRKVKDKLPDLYSDIDYSIAMSIFEEMSSLSNIKIYSFQ